MQGSGGPRSSSGGGAPPGASGVLDGDLYQRARSVMGETSAAVDALSAFMQARAALEESHAKSLARLSKTALNVSESALHPAVFEALASLRGDIVNESVQHRELATAIAKDVIEPLASLRESAEMVVRVVRAGGVAVRAGGEQQQQLLLQWLLLRASPLPCLLALGRPPPLSPLPHPRTPARRARRRPRRSARPRT